MPARASAGTCTVNQTCVVGVCQGGTPMDCSHLTQGCFDGVCNVRFDDTNPVKEEVEFEEAIQQDVHWLGFDWGDRLFFASDYFDQLYQCAVELIEKEKAFVCSLDGEEIRATRGTLT